MLRIKSQLRLNRNAIVGQSKKQVKFEALVKLSEEEQ